MGNLGHPLVQSARPFALTSSAKCSIIGAMERTFCGAVLLVFGGTIACSSMGPAPLGDASVPGDVSVDAAPDAMPDAPPDAAPDAAPALARFDVGYIDEFTLPANQSGIVGFLVVINKGMMPLNLAKAQVISVSDDQAAITTEFEPEPGSDAMIAPNTAAGLLGISAIVALVDSGLVPEPIVNDELNFALSFRGQPAANIDLRVQVTLQIEDARVTLPFTIHLITENKSQINHVARLGSQ